MGPNKTKWLYFSGGPHVISQWHQRIWSIFRNSACQLTTCHSFARSRLFSELVSIVFTTNRRNGDRSFICKSESHLMPRNSVLSPDWDSNRLLNSICLSKLSRQNFATATCSTYKIFLLFYIVLLFRFSKILSITSRWNSRSLLPIGTIFMHNERMAVFWMKRVSKWKEVVDSAIVLRVLFHPNVIELPISQGFRIQCDQKERLFTGPLYFNDIKAASAHVHIHSGCTNLEPI